LVSAFDGLVALLVLDEVAGAPCFLKNSSASFAALSEEDIFFVFPAISNGFTIV
jgi:hypothetical protein